MPKKGRYAHLKGSSAYYPFGARTKLRRRQRRHVVLLRVVGLALLVPAALENAISRSNAGNVRARFIVEGANGPITPAADEILEANGVTVVTDILANAGGVVVSYFEWVQNLQSFRWEEDYVNDMLERTMRHAFDEVWALAEERRASLRMGAYMSALKRVVGAKKLRGIFP